MADLLKTSSDWLEARRKAYASQAVVYHRDATSVSVSATVGRTEFEEVEEYGIVIKRTSVDFLIQATDLVLESVQVTPRRGDWIEYNGRKHEVLPFGDQPEYRRSDLYGVVLRIHTKDVGAS